MNIVFVNPEIPQNTGSTARLCAATGAVLHLVGRLGFRIDSASVKRAGLDYWESVDVRRHASFDDFIAAAGQGARLWLFTKRAERAYSDVEYSPDDYLVFGCESVGLPKSITAKFSGRLLRIPIRDEVRSLNLATSAGIVLYEALRQMDFAGIESVGAAAPKEEM